MSAPAAARLSALRWERIILSSLLALALVTRDGRYQPLTMLMAGGLVLVMLKRRTSLLALRPGLLAAFVLWSTLSVTWSEWPSDSLRQISNFLLWTALGATLACYGSLSFVLELWSRVARAVIIVTFVLSVAELAGPELVGSVFNSKNHLGFALASSLIPLVVRAPRAAGSGPWVVAAAISAALNDTQTGLLLCLMVPALVLVAKMVKNTASDIRGGLLVVLSMATIALAMISFDQLLVFGSSAVGRDASLSGRDQLWSAVIEGIEREPLVGAGLGGVWFRPEQEPTLAILSDLPLHIQSAAVYAHNGLLDTALQLGIPAALMLVLVVGSALRRSIRLLPSARDAHGSAAFVVIIVFVIANVTESRVFNDQAWVLLTAFTMMLRHPSVLHEAYPAASDRAMTSAVRSNQPERSNSTAT